MPTRCSWSTTSWLRLSRKSAAALSPKLLLHQIPQQTRRHRKLRECQPRTRDLLHRGADAVDLGLARGDPGFHRFGARPAVAGHGGGEPALGVADRVERAVERQAVEIVGDLD